MAIRVIGVGDNVVDKYMHTKTMYPGGNAFNFSAYASMLGASSSYMGVFGSDEAAQLVQATARELGIGLREGVYMYFPGPQYETPAEVRAARVLGADAAGMSTAPEVITAGHCGMRVLGFTLLSNMGAGILDQPLSEQEVLDAAAACRDKFSRLVLACLKKID